MYLMQPLEIAPGQDFKEHLSNFQRLDMRFLVIDADWVLSSLFVSFLNFIVIYSVQIHNIRRNA